VDAAAAEVDAAAAEVDAAAEVVAEVELVACLFLSHLPPTNLSRLPSRRRRRARLQRDAAAAAAAAAAARGEVSLMACCFSFLIFL
jgi:hypothetical protein